MTHCPHPPDKQHIYAVHLWPMMSDIECRDCWETRPYAPEMDEQRRALGLTPFAERGTGWLVQELDDARR